MDKWHRVKVISNNQRIVDDSQMKITNGTIKTLLHSFNSYCLQNCAIRNKHRYPPWHSSGKAAEEIQWGAKGKKRKKKSKLLEKNVHSC